MTTNGHSRDGITGEVLETAADAIRQLMAQDIYDAPLTRDQWDQVGRMAKIAGGTAEGGKEPLLYDWLWRNLADAASPYETDIYDLVEKFGHLRAKDLELRTTVVYVWDMTGAPDETSIDDVANLVKELRSRQLAPSRPRAPLAVSYPAISLTTASVGRRRCPKSACRSPANLPSTRIRARIIAPVTPSPPLPLSSRRPSVDSGQRIEYAIAPRSAAVYAEGYAQGKDKAYFEMSNFDWTEP